MGAAALNWIHDNSKDQLSADRWNHSSLSVRAKLLKEASRDPYQKHLSWDALPELVRADVTYAIQRQEKRVQESEAAAKAEGAKRAHHHPIAANDPRLWWNRD